VLFPEAETVVGDGITIIPPEDPPDPPQPDWPSVNVNFPVFPPTTQRPPAVPKPKLPSSCSGDSPNGPYNMYVYGYADSLESDHTTITIYYPCKLKASTSDNPTKIIFTGNFYRLVGGVYQPSNDNDFYEVLALNSGLQTVAEANVTGTGNTREGTFNNPSEVSVSYFRVKVNNVNIGYQEYTPFLPLGTQTAIPGDRGIFGEPSYNQPLSEPGFKFHEAFFGSPLVLYNVGMDANPFGVGACCIMTGQNGEYPFKVRFTFYHSAGRYVSIYPHVRSCVGPNANLYGERRFLYSGTHEVSVPVRGYFDTLNDGLMVHFAELLTGPGEYYSIENVSISVASAGGGCIASGGGRVELTGAFLYNICRR
jgi:hypothetical protein